MVLFGLPQWIALIWLFLFGAAIGSFLNVCIYRFPQHDRFADQLRALLSPPSSCPRCQNRIPLYDNIPIIGWLKLGGRCRFCRGGISIRYPLIELANGLLFVVVYWFEIPGDLFATFADNPFFLDPLWTAGGPRVDWGPQGVAGSIWLSERAVLHWRYLYHIVLLESLLVATFIDFDHLIIPDGSTMPAMAVGLLAGGVIGQVYLVPVWFQERSLLLVEVERLLPEPWNGWLSGAPIPAWINAHPHLHGLAVSLVGLIVGGGIVWAVRLIGRWVLRQEAMGFGDVILMATIGSFLGWQPTVVVFFIAPGCALVVILVSWAFRRDREIPYGPYLSLAAVIVLLGWRWIWPWAHEHIFSAGPLLPVIAVVMAVMLAVCLQLVQLGKRLLGIPLYPEEEWYEEWTSADQLTFLANQPLRPDECDDQSHHWEGTSAGRGIAFEQRWRGDTKNGWQQQWQRRGPSTDDG